MDALTDPRLVSHLFKKYGDQLERDEIQAELWIAAATAGARTGKALASFVCNSVIKKAKAGLMLINPLADMDLEIERAENNGSIFHGGDPLDILIAQEFAEKLVRGGVDVDEDIEGYDKGICRRAQLKRKAATKKRVAKLLRGVLK